jgi:hypothetical protein
MRPAVTITIRRRTSGHKVAALACDSLEHAYTIACIIVQAPEYARCFLAGTDWTGAEIFTVGLQPPAYSAPAPAPYPVPPAYGYAPALPPAPAYPQPCPRPPPWPEDIVEAEPIEPFAPPPRALPPRRW